MTLPSARTRVVIAVVAVAAIGAVILSNILGFTPKAAIDAIRNGVSSLTHNAPTVLNSDGSVDPAAYRALATELATPTGIEYRFGEPAGGAADTSASTAPGVTEKFYDGHGDSTNRTYQLGGPQLRSRDDYSSDQGQVGYVATGSSPKIGVDQIETLSMSENTFSSEPRLSWTYYGKGHPDPDLEPGSAAGDCIAKLGTSAGRFVAQARAYAFLEDTANSIVAFDNGIIAAAGTNTARGGACTQLPAHLHPSAISVTGGNEFALVTAWNDQTLRSELVVIALGGSKAKGEFWSYDWQALYPGLRNYGRPTFAKVLGTIPLPMAAATSVSAVADVSGSQVALPQGGHALLGDLTLSNEKNRQSFIDGLNKDAIANAGYAVVASREEKKVVFVDLQPLFEQVTDAYFGTKARFDEITSNIGLGATQWPLPFSALPAEQPVVVKTITTASAPSAVAAMLSGADTPRAYVATVDGHLDTYAVGGLADSSPASADAISKVGSIPVGSNPTWITHVKDRGVDGVIKQGVDDTLIVTARGDRAVQWVHLSGNGGSVVRTLKDSRIVDPIAAEDNNNHGTESYVISIADYTGKQLLNYRYGPVIFHTNGGSRFGMGPDGKSPFEFSGAYRPGGMPFSISVTNVT